MAGMDWFRWHHGSVNDSKFQLVARKAGASVAEVIAVWATLLEAASQEDERGTIGDVDFEAIDCALGMTEGKCAAIHGFMMVRGLIEGGYVVAWDKRQPKRERDDLTNSDRQRTFKGKKNQVTPDNTNLDQKTPRVEESREDEINTSTSVDVAPTAGEACKVMKTAGMQSVNPSNPKLVALLAAGITLAELFDAANEAVNKGKPFAYALATAEGRRRDSVTAALPAACASETVYQRSMRERVAEIAPELARRAPGDAVNPSIFFANIKPPLLEISR